MYWFRDQSIINFLPWLLSSAAWSLGGWLIVSKAFDIDKNKRLMLGFGLGLVIYLWLINLIGHWTSPNLTYLLSAFTVLVTGLLISKQGEGKFLDPAVFSAWPILLVWAAIFIYSLLLERGLMIFDEQLQLPAISVIGAGSFPPKYFLNANSPFAYHYGSQLLGASLMRIGGMFAWSASDFSRALVWSFSLILLGLVANQYIKNTRKTVVGILAFTFLGGTRYLLMLLPYQVLQTFDKWIGFIGVSASLNTPFSKALYMPWTTIPGPPKPFLFGFFSGIYPTYHMYHTSQWPLALVIIILIWLLSTKLKSWKSIPFIAILWSLLALTYESGYALLGAAMVLIFFYQLFNKKSGQADSFNFVLTALVLSLPIALLQGGSLNSIVQSALLKFTGSQALISVHNKTTEMFSFNWPPTIFSPNFGDLSVFNPAQLIVGLMEIGPILFFIPLIMKFSQRKFTSGDWMIGCIAISTLLGAIAATFIRYNPSRDAIVRFSEYVVALWYFLLIPVIFAPDDVMKRWTRILAIGCMLLASIGGIANFLAQISAIPKPVLSDHITGLDARISSQTWGKLPADEIIFDPNPFDGRASEVTGLPTVVWEYRQVLPFWQEIYDHPSLEGILQYKYRYVYIDEKWWAGLTESQKASLSKPCIKAVAEASSDNEFRRLLDLEQCAVTS